MWCEITNLAEWFPTTKKKKSFFADKYFTKSALLHSISILSPDFFTKGEKELTLAFLNYTGEKATPSFFSRVLSRLSSRRRLARLAEIG